MGVFAPDALADWLRTTLFWAGAVLFIVGVVAAASHFASAWFARNVWWRLRLKPPLPSNETGTTQAVDGSTLIPLPRPDFTAPTTPYPYAYPKALLSLSIADKNGQREGAPPHKVVVRSRITNKHNSNLTGCYAIARTIQCGDKVESIDLPLRVTSEGRFQVSANGAQSAPILRRDISDPVTPEPFTLLFRGKEWPLAENATYFLTVELGTAFPYPILATLQIDTETGTSVMVRVLNERLMGDQGGR